MNHSVRACVKNTAKTIVSLIIMLTACSSLSSNNSLFSSSKDKRMVCSTSAAAICKNANYNSDKFNEDLLASIKENERGEKKSNAESTLGQKIVGYTSLGATIIIYTGLLIFDHNLSSHPPRR